MDEHGFWKNIALWALGVGMAVLSYFLKGIDSQNKKNKIDIQANRIELLEFKLQAEEKFSKEITTQDSLRRIHDRIDESNKDMHSGLNEIKTILINNLMNKG